MTHLEKTVMISITTRTNEKDVICHGNIIFVLRNAAHVYHLDLQIVHSLYVHNI